MPLAPNPYPGPRPFKRSEILFGREQETRQLLDLLFAERIVLLFSPSGAGKTSLLRAAIMPALEREGDFDVVPILRVGAIPDRDAPAEANRYELSALQVLEAEAPEAERRSIQVLASLGLEACLDARIAAAATEAVTSAKISGSASLPRQSRRARPTNQRENQLLILDQFEEVLLADPSARDFNVVSDSRHAFFDVLGRILRNRNRWAIVAMREDRLGEIQPFLGPIPTRFRNRFRLDLLDHEAAKLAIRLPARYAGVQKGLDGRPDRPETEPPIVDFHADAVDKVVINLARSRVKADDDSSAGVIGRYVEPLYLQVVCNFLWDNLKPEIGGQIDAGQIDETLNIDEVLAAYYSQTLQDALAGQSGVTESYLRLWIQKWLITPNGRRTQVMEGEGTTNGLANAVLRSLVPKLIRADTWNEQLRYELLHDRLIDPIRASNAAWDEKERQQVPLKAQSHLWVKAGKPIEGAAFIPLSGQALEEADSWASAHPGEMTEDDQRFLDLSKQTRERIQAAIAVETARAARAEAEAKAALAIEKAKIAALEVEKERADRAEAEAKARAVRVEEANERFRSRVRLAVPVIALALFAGVYKTRSEFLKTENEKLIKESELKQEKITAAEQTQLAAEQMTRRSIVRQLSNESRLVIQQDRRLSGRLAVAARKIDEQFKLPWNPEPESLIRQVLNASAGQRLERHKGAVEAVAFSPKGNWLVTAGEDGQPLQWDVTDPATPRYVRSLATQRGTEFTVARFSPSGQWFALGGQKRSGRVANIPVMLYPAEPTRPGGANVANTSQTGWDTSHSSDPGIRLSGHAGAVTVIAFSPDSSRLATGGNDAEVWVWDVGLATKTKATPRLAGCRLQVSGTDKRVRALGFRGGSGSLVGVTAQNHVLIWDGLGPAPPETPSKPPTTDLKAFKEIEVTAAAVSATGRYAVAGNGDGSIFLWDLNKPSSEPPTHLREKVNNRAITAMSISDDDKWLFAGDALGGVVAWELGSTPLNVEGITLKPHNSQVIAIAFSIASVVTTDAEGGATVWNLSSPTPTERSSIVGQGPRVRASGIDPTGKRLATGGVDGIARLYDLTALDPIEPQVVRVPFAEDWLWFDKSNSVIITVNDRINKNNNMSTACFLVQDGRLVQPPVITGVSVDSVCGILAFSPRSQALFGIPTGAVLTLPLTSPVLPGALLQPPRVSTPDPPLTFVSGSLVVLPSEGNVTLLFPPDGKGIVWNSDTVSTKAPLSLRSFVDISPDGQWIAERSGIHGLRLIKISNLTDIVSQEWQPPESDTRPVALVRFLSPTQLLTGRENGLLEVWRLDSEAKTPPTLIMTLQGHSAEVKSIARTAENTLISADVGGSIRIWRLLDESPESPKSVLEPVTIPPRETISAIIAVAVSNDGARFATLSENCELRLWRLRTADLLAVAEKEFGGPLTRAEWERFVGKESLPPNSDLLKGVVPDQ